MTLKPIYLVKKPIYSSLPISFLSVVAALFCLSTLELVAFGSLPGLPDGWKTADVIAVGQPKLIEDFDQRASVGLYAMKVTTSYRGVEKGEILTFLARYWTSSRFPSQDREQIFFLRFQKDRSSTLIHRTLDDHGLLEANKDYPACYTFFDWNSETKQSVELISQFSAWNQQRQESELRKFLNKPESNLLHSYAKYEAQRRQFPEVIAKFVKQMEHGETAEQRVNAVTALRSMKYNEKILHQHLNKWTKDPEFELFGEAARRMRQELADCSLLWAAYYRKTGSELQKVMALQTLLKFESATNRQDVVDQVVKTAAETDDPTVQSNALYTLTFNQLANLSEANVATIAKLHIASNNKSANYTRNILKKHDQLTAELELPSRLLGRWQYIRIEAEGKQLPIHDGDRIVFTETMIDWRWLGKDHQHRYKRLDHDGHRAFIVYHADGRAYLKGIYQFLGDDLMICNQAAEKGFPKRFSAKSATMIRLRRIAEK